MSVRLRMSEMYELDATLWRLPAGSAPLAVADAEIELAAAVCRAFWALHPPLEFGL